MASTVRYSRYVKRIGIATGTIGTVWALDKYLYYSTLQRNFKTLFAGLIITIDYKLNFHADTRISAAKLPLALNQHLPPDIRVLDAQVVPEDFHARYAAHTKTYLYRIHNHPIDSPFDAAYYTRVPRHLDEARMQAAAQQFVGRHDFLALCAAGSSAAAHGATVRTITDCHVTREGDEIDIEVTADGYLYNMVRILAGTLCEAGAGRLDPAEIPAILESRDRSRAGPTLPAKGLFLKCVEYDL